jgi:DNA-directed RNA polymerase subunit E'/Rpb7
MKQLSAIVFFLIILFIIIGCDPTDKPARGFEDEIFVLADSAEYLQFKDVLDSTFEKLIYTPQPEKIFTLKRINSSEMSKYKRKKNLVFIAPLNSNSETSEFIRAAIDSAIENKLKEDPDFIVYKEDLWAKNQIIVILSAPNADDLKSKILRNSDNLLYKFQKISDKRLFGSLYQTKYEQQDIEGKFLQDYGWVIYVQADYKVAKNAAEDNFVWIRRSPGSDMERWIFVHWIDNATPEYLNEDSIKTIRNRITQKYYRTADNLGYVVIAEDYFTINEVNFNDRYALFTQGLWDLNIKGMGGPFVNYIFYDEDTQRLYMLDGSLYAPKFYKRNLIQQMDVTLQSFRTEKELTDNRREDLLDAAKD